MKKYYRLCKNFAEVKQFSQDVKKVTGVPQNYDWMMDLGTDWFPKYMCTSSDVLSHMPIRDFSGMCGKSWLEGQGYANLPSSTVPRTKESLVELIFKETGCTVTKVKGNLYKVDTKEGERRFRISVMDKDGGVDLKYRQWAEDFDLVVEGEGAMKVRSRIDGYVGMFIFSVDEFINRIKG